MIEFTDLKLNQIELKRLGSRAFHNNPIFSTWSNSVGLILRNLTLFLRKSEKRIYTISFLPACQFQFFLKEVFFSTVLAPYYLRKKSLILLKYYGLAMKCCSVTFRYMLKAKSSLPLMRYDPPRTIFPPSFSCRV